MAREGAAAMIVYPAMELMGGRCVALAQRRLGDVASYITDPVDAVLGFENEGAEWAHIVDLDGAREGGPRQHGLIVDIALSVSLKLQVAGGFRTREQLQRMFDAGVDRVVINSLAVADPDLVRDWLEAFGADHIAIALDVTLVGGTPVVGGGEDPGRTLWDVAALYPEARHLLISAVGGDAAGPATALIADAAERLPQMAIQTFGGIASLADLSALKRAGAAGAIVGKALWDNRIGVGEAIEVARA